jgi:flagellar hook-associated protein 2
MSTISSSTGVNGTSNNESSLLAQAAQSILSGATGSQLDVNSLVQALVNAKIAGQAQTIANAVATDKTTISALGSVQSALSGIQTGLGGLADGSIFGQLAVSFSGSGITAQTTSGAAPATYSIQVSQIATANQISSQSYAANATLGTGTVTVGVGSNSVTINLDSSNNTLAGLAAAINNASGNPGVSAAVVTGTNGQQQLLLTSTATGQANAVTISGSAGVDPGLATANFVQVTPGQDAKLTIGNTNIDSPTNTISGVLSGVTLTLTQAAVGPQQTLTLAADNSSIATQVQKFVTAYNAWVSSQQQLGSFNPTAAAGSQGGPLLGDSMLNSAVNGLGSILANGITVGGTTYNLAQIGINLNHDGTLSLDTSTLNATLKNSPSTVAAIFNGTNGFGQQLNSFISSFTDSTTGQIAQRTSALNSDLTTQSQAQSNLVAFEATLTAQYQAQFTQLNTLLTQTQNETSYLNQLFGGGGLSGSINSKG